MNKIDTVEAIKEKLMSMLKEHLGPLRIRVDSETNFEVCGTIEAMQGKKKVDGFYFASLVPKAKDVRLYFFPIYTHVDEFDVLSESLQKFKKGKSCFHVKFLNDELVAELSDLFRKGIELYQQDGLLVKS